MIEVCLVILIIFACIIGAVYIVKWINILIDCHGEDRVAGHDVEERMRRNDVVGVQALLDTRGHLLKHEVRDNIKIWLSSH